LQIEDPAGLKFQITFPEDALPETRPFQRLFLHALLLELALRDPSTHKPEAPPRWLVDALLDRLCAESLEDPGEHLQPLLESGQIPSLETVLSRLETDPSPSSPADEAVARCLLNLVLGQRDVGPGILGLLQNPGNPGHACTRFLTLFPSLAANEAELQRVWTLQLASQATRRQRTQLDSIQTQREIQKLLEISVLNPLGIPRTFQLEQFSEFLRLPGIKEILNSRHLEFSALLARAHFYFTEPLEIYADVCRNLAGGQTERQADRLQRARELCESSATSLARIREYLIWFNAERAPLLRRSMAESPDRVGALSETPEKPGASRSSPDLEEENRKIREQEADLLEAIAAAASRRSQNKASAGPLEKGDSAKKEAPPLKR
jgi:hypothetical protein